MPYRSKRRRRLYAARWRKEHPRYMRDYCYAVYHGQQPDCLLTKPADSPLIPIQSGAEIRAGLQLPAHEPATS